ncbi:unnamed protein product [Calypogeia fissa]
MGETSDEDRIAQVVLAMMQTLKREEAEEKELRKKADEQQKVTERLGKCLHERSTLFLRSASEALREELENAIDLLDPMRLDITEDWDQLEKAVMKVSNRHRRRELDKEAVSERVMPPESKPEVKVETKMEASPSMDGLLEMMKNLSILTT